MKRLEIVNNGHTVIASEAKQSLKPGFLQALSAFAMMGIIALAVIFISILAANAETLTIKSSPSFRLDGTGEYAMPQVSSSGEYSSNEFIATAGQIKSISANYEFSGKVSLEVSADSGLHYYPVVNGATLKNKFVSGNRLKWRAKALDNDSKLINLNINYTDSAGTIAGFGEPKLSGSNYRKEIQIKNPSGEELFNYQIKIKVGETKDAQGMDLNCEGKALKDFNDIRFSAQDAQSPLNYYLESVTGESPKQIATFWVKVPQIPKGGISIYIYYGNALAKTLSNPKSTFDFYDDFKGEDLDKNTWILKADQKGSYGLTGTQLKLDAAQIIAKDFKFKEGIIEYSLKVESGFENSLTLGEKSDDTYTNPGLVLYSSAYKGAEHCIAINDIVKANDAKAKPPSAGENYNYRLTLNNNKVTFERINPVSAQVEAKVSYSDDKGIAGGYIGLKSGGDGRGMNVISYDGIRCRKFAEKEPVVESAEKEEEVELATFGNISLSNKNYLTLADKARDGLYIGKDIPAPFNARIMVGQVTGKNASLSLSADAGKTYKENCADSVYYYASAKDFSAGSQIVAKIKLAKDKNGSSQLEELKVDYNPGTILVAKPNGGESLLAGSSEEIAWLASGYSKDYPMKIEYSNDAGKNYNEITAKAENSGSYSWKVPADSKSDKCLIRVTDSKDSSIKDQSDKVFSVKAGEVSKQEAAASKQEVIAVAIPAPEVLKEVKEEIVETPQQTKAELNNLNHKYVLNDNATIATKALVAFKTLTIGDGKGKNKTRLILKNAINPNSGSIIIRKGGELVQANSDSQTISGDLIIENGGILTHSVNKVDKQSVVDLNAANITLNPGGIVNVSAKGYSGGDVAADAQGKAAGKYIGKSKLAGGGSHNTYDTQRMPYELGSGGSGSALARGGAGGGAIKLVAKGEFSISGIINADGEAGAGGGAGGSIYLRAQKFSGSGAEITATGGSGDKTGAAGSGGRIHIKAPSGKISGTMNVNGGPAAEAGSVIVE